ncbi:MAG: ADOP family duplicated permease [Acidobacteriaceae bacterium]
MSWLDHLFSRNRRYDDVAVSIQEHLEERTEELMEDGLSREQAAQKARREFGNVTVISERSREAWQWPTLESIWADVKFASLRLAKSPGFAATVILTLAIGIGANTGVFSVLNSVLIKPLAYPNSEELVGVRLIAPGAAGLANFTDGLRLSPSMYFTYAEHNRIFQSMGVWIRGTANVTGLAQPEQVHTALISDGVLQALRVPPVLGRSLSQGDQNPHGAKAVMLSYGYWQRRFGGERSAIGRSITIDSQPREIVGVMPQGFRLVNADFDLLVPLAFDRNKQILAGFAYQGIARLKPGITIAQADADITRMLPIWMDSWSNGPGINSHFYEVWKITPALRPLKEEVIGTIGNLLWVVMGTLGVVMLIACANVANLVLVRAEARQQELAIRAALGAGRARIARDLLTESMLLGLLGGAFGVGFAYAGLRILVAIGPADLPRLSEISLDAGAFVFTLVLSLLSGLLFGLIPVLKYAGRRTSLTLASAGRTASVSRERHHSRNVLVVAQVAMALVLLVSAGLMIRTFEALRTVEPGFADAEHLQTMRISIPASLVANPQMVTRIQNNIADKLAAIPGVTSAAFASTMPMEGGAPDWDEIFVEGKLHPGETAPLRLFKYASPGFFHTAGTRIVAGREFTWPEIYGVRPVGIISENLAREYWGTPAAALGKRFREFPSMPWHEVVGVVQDVRENGVHEQAPAIVYWPLIMTYGPGPFDAIRSVTFVIRSDRAGTESFLNEIRQAVWSVNSSLPLASVQTMREIYSQSLGRTSFTLLMLGVAGAMALVLGIIGIYGVISYAVEQRTREIGIRLALGAERSRILHMVIGHGLRLTVVGVAAGAMIALLLARLLSGFSQLLYGVRASDPITFFIVSATLIIVAILACYLPARRAASIEPMTALRTE